MKIEYCLSTLVAMDFKRPIVTFFIATNYTITEVYHEKIDMISGLTEYTAKDVVRNEENWRKYLNTASRLYKYSFKDQLLIYAQRPDATAVHRDME